MYEELAILALFVFLYSLIASRIERSAGSAQDVFLARSDLGGAEAVLRQTIGGRREARRALEILLGCL